MALVIVWAAHRESKVGKLINQRLVELRADGEIIDAAFLARMSPSPPLSLNAANWTNAAFPFAEHHNAPKVTPLVRAETPLARTQAIDPPTLSVLRRHYEESSNITNVMPLLPVGARFGTDWSHGMLKAPGVSFLGARQTIQMLSARAVYAAEVGDTEGATAMLERTFQLAGALSLDSTLLEHRFRGACLDLCCTITERCLNRASFTDAQLQRLLAIMPPPATNGLLGTMRVENSLVTTVFSAVRDGERLDDYLPSNSHSWWQRAWKRFWSGRNEYNDEDFLAYLELIPRELALTKLTPRLAVHECSLLFSDFGTHATSDVAKALIPNWANVMHQHFERAGKLEATRAALQVERYRHRHHALPESLTNLVPSFAAAVPRDIIDESALRFKRQARGFTIYSIGMDGVDNGGVEKSFMPAESPYDVTVTVER